MVELSINHKKKVDYSNLISKVQTRIELFDTRDYLPNQSAIQAGLLPVQKLCRSPRRVFHIHSSSLYERPVAVKIILPLRQFRY